jgi:hypothetical protein
MKHQYFSASQGNLIDSKPRPEFTSRRKQIFTAIIIGIGSDDEPIIDASTICEV